MLHKKSQKIFTLHQRLLSYAKTNGLPQTSTAIFYKIHNLINSIITSVSIVEVKMTTNSIGNLFKTIELLNINQSKLDFYLTKDHVGKKIPKYLMLLSVQMQIELKQIVKEINFTFKKIKSIENLLHIYKSINHVVSNKNKIILSVLINEIMQCFSSLILQHNIVIANNYKCHQPLFVDKEKLTEILMHIIKNAIDALLLSDKKHKKLNIYIQQHTNKLVKISVKDNGVGIDVKHLAQIFSFGFTTKKNGHGFNLYNSYIKAKELGGILKVDSKGISLGATFTLLMPYNIN